MSAERRDVSVSNNEPRSYLGLSLIQLIAIAAVLLLWAAADLYFLDRLAKLDEEMGEMSRRVAQTGEAMLEMAKRTEESAARAVEAERQARLAAQGRTQAQEEALQARNDASSARVEAEAARQEAREAQQRAEEVDRAREEELNRLQSSLNRIAETRRTALGLVMNLGSDALQFEFDKADLRPQNRELLSRIVGILLTLEPGYGIYVYGHTDDVGSEAYNQRLSERRAEAVRDYLVAGGVDPSLITTKGFGKTRPLVRGTDAQARTQNRRVEIGIINTSVRYDRALTDQ